MIERWGYPVEQHEVTTEDGYILTVFRIKHGVNSSGFLLLLSFFVHLSFYRLALQSSSNNHGSQFVM